MQGHEQYQGLQESALCPAFARVLAFMSMQGEILALLQDWEYTFVLDSQNVKLGHSDKEAPATPDKVRCARDSLSVTVCLPCTKPPPACTLSCNLLTRLIRAQVT